MAAVRSVRPRGWLNFDASMTLRIERIPVLGRLARKNAFRFHPAVAYGDIVSGLPIPDNSCAAVYACHVIEHLTLQEARNALRNTLRILKPGGLFRVVVPDLRAAAENYLSDDRPVAAHELMRSTYLGQETRGAGALGLLIRLFGRSTHLWMWDERSLSHELSAAGFRGIRSCAFNDSSEAMFKRIEVADRYVDAVAIECSK